MGYRTMRIAISDEEMQELNSLALAEYRRPRDQARYILRRVLLDDQPEEKHNGAVSIRQDTHGAVAAIAG